MADSHDPLEGLVDRLEAVAAELRAGGVAPERAAVLVDECARLAAEVGQGLDRAVRAQGEDADPSGGQLPLA